MGVACCVDVHIQPDRYHPLTHSDDRASRAQSAQP
jgi:hypothetical protein